MLPGRALWFESYKIDIRDAVWFYGASYTRRLSPRITHIFPPDIRAVQRSKRSFSVFSEGCFRWKAERRLVGCDSVPQVYSKWTKKAFSKHWIDGVKSKVHLESTLVTLQSRLGVLAL